VTVAQGHNQNSKGKIMSPTSAAVPAKARVKDRLGMVAFDLECIIQDGAFLTSLDEWRAFYNLCAKWLETIRRVRGR
jgi:hypothetical protein